MSFRKDVLAYLPKIKVILTVVFICLLMAGLSSCQPEEGGTIVVKSPQSSDVTIYLTDMNNNNISGESLLPGWGSYSFYVSLDGYYRVHCKEGYRPYPYLDVYVSGGEKKTVWAYFHR